MRLVRYEIAGQCSIGVLRDDGIVSLAPFFESGDGGLALEQVIAGWSESGADIRDFVNGATPSHTLSEARIMAPLTRPSKIVGIGSNYPRPGDENAPQPSAPILFLKPPSALTGPTDPIILPIESRNVIGEVELAIVIGKAGRRLSPEQAGEYIFGYTVANDVTAGDVLFADAHLNPLFLQQARAKGFASFCPIGPCIATADDFEWPLALNLEQRLDGSREIEGNTRDMALNAAALVAEVSHAFGVEAGDLILSGSSAPIGGKRTPLRDGAVLHSAISGIGALANPVVAE